LTKETTVAIKEGWTGRVYEDFEVGDIYPHPLGRTIISADNVWFTLLTQNTNPIHFDHAYASKTEFGRPLVDSTFTLALVTGGMTCGCRRPSLREIPSTPGPRCWKSENPGRGQMWASSG
jgi:acyl dehydratase